MSKTKICKKCGEELPLTIEYFHARVDKGVKGFKNTCKRCVSKQSSDRYIENQEKMKQKNKDYYQINKEKISQRNSDHYYNGGGKETKAKYNQEHKEELQRKKKEFAENNKEVIRKRSHTYYWENGGKEKSREYRENNKEKVRSGYRNYYHSPRGHAIIITIKNRRWSLENKLLSTLTPEEWLETLDYFDNSCAYCGTSEADLHRDHVIPLSKGGFYVQSNVIPACQKCNSSKHAHDMQSWYKMQPFFSELNLKKILKWTGLKPNSEIQQMSMF